MMEQARSAPSPLPIARLVYTAVPYGQGYNPSLSGYQVKACSSTLSSDQIEKIGGICMHYGDVVYRGAPQDAVDHELTWRTQTEDAHNYPEEVLQRFPQIIAYTRLDEETYSLIRVTYTGLTYDNRPGNFLALALVVTPSALSAYHGNPLVAVRAGIFEALFSPADLAAERVDLPPLPIPENTHPIPGFDQLIAPPYSDHLAELVAAAHDASESTRPVMLNLQDWHLGAALVEQLLYLLPPEVRSRTSLCTYETDRTWQPALHGQRPAGWVAGHRLVVLGSPGTGGVNFRADELASRFSVFDFTSAQFSPVEAGRYSQWAVRCARDGRYADLESFYNMLARLGFSGDASTCDLLVGINNAGNNDSAQAARSAEALAGLAVQNGQTQAALVWLGERVDALAGLNDHGKLHDLRSAVIILMGSLSAEDPVSKAFLEQLEAHAQQALKQGHVRTAVQLLHMARDTQHDILSAVLSNQNFNAPSGKDTLERTAWLDLLLEALSSLDADSVKVNFPALVSYIFSSADELDRSQEIWGRIGEAEVFPYLEKGWDEDRQRLAEDLLKLFDPAVSPAPAARIALLLAAHAAQPDKSWRSYLLIAAQAVEAYQSPDDLVSQIDQVVASRQISGEESLVIKGLLVGCAPSGRIRDRYLDEYKSGMAELKPAQRNSVHRELAAAGASELLVDEFLADISQADEGIRKNTLQHWRDVVFSPHPKVYECLCSRIAGMLRSNADDAEILWLAQAMIPSKPPQVVPDAMKELYESLIMAFPLLPVEEGKGINFQLPGGLPEGAYLRARLLAFLQDVYAKSQQPGWSLEHFPAREDEWRKAVKSLPPVQKGELVNWALGSFDDTGVTTSEHAAGLTDLMNNCGEMDQLGTALGAMLQGRDPVTWVIAATAFLDFAQKLKDGKQAQMLVRLALQDFDRNHRRLLEEHAWNRFGAPQGKAQDRLVEIFQGAGLSLPRNLQPVVKESSEKAVQKKETAPTPINSENQAKEKSTGIFSRFGPKLGGLIRSSESKTSKDKQEKQ